MNKFFIKPYQQKILTDIFDVYCPNAEIWAYGSRVGGDAHSGSDLDLTIKSFNDVSCSIVELRRRITDSDIPFFVDINMFDSLPESFKQEVLENYIVFYKK